MDTETNRFLRALPKADLHCHIVGELRPETFRRMAEMNGVDLAGIDPASVFDYSGAFDVHAFLPVLGKMSEVMRSEDDFAQVIYESLVDAAEEANLVYREMSVNLYAHSLWGVSPGTILRGLSRGIKAAAADRDVSCRLIVDIERLLSSQAARDIVQEAIDNRVDELVGIGLVGWEEPEDAPRKFIDAFRLAKQHGLRRTAHVAERCSPFWISDAVDLLDCERIDHGYLIVEEPELLARCRDMELPFTSTPTATSICDGWPLPEHPLRTMIASGLTVSIGADARSWGVTLQSEYETLAEVFEMSREAMLALALTAVDTAWMDDGERRSLRQRMIQCADQFAVVPA